MFTRKAPCPLGFVVSSRLLASMKTPRTAMVVCGPLPRVLVRPPALLDAHAGAKLCATQRRLPRRVMSASAHRRDRGSTSSTSAATVPSAARTAGKRFWTERRPKEVCPACGGELRETEERRRETKGGFACRKDCQAALTRKLTTLGRAHLRPAQPPQPAGVPAQGLAAGDRERRPGRQRCPATACWWEQHLVPQLGAVQLQSLNAAQINAHYARLLRRWSGPWFRWPLPQHRAPRPCRPAPRPARRRCVIHAKPNTDSTASRTLIPRQAEH